MKDILNIMRLDFLTAKPTAVPVWGIVTLMCSILALFIAPMCAAYSLLSSLLILSIPASTAEHCGFNKLYGILPVDRKNITRGRFAFMYTLLFVTEVLALVVIRLSVALQLWRILPFGDSEMAQLSAQSFDPEVFINYGTSVGIFAVLCLFFCYMEMMAQIYGRENEMKIICITLMVITVVGLSLGWLSNHDMIPLISMDKLTGMSFPGKVIVSIAVNLAVLALTVLFSEITAAKVSRREL